MSDTYFIRNLKCAYCGENNDFGKDAMEHGHTGLPYTSEFGGKFICDSCKRQNEIVMNIVVVASESQGKLIKDFDGWNTIKKQAHAEKPRLYTVREIWWCRLGINIGTEQDGKGDLFLRPVVIMRGFGADACLVVPLTTSAREHALRIPVGMVEGYPARANISQMRIVDARRLVEKVGFLEKDIFAALRKAAKALL